MKKYFYLFLMLPVLMFGQQKKYDYFVQFNTPQFAKKVNVDSLFNHKAFQQFNKVDAKVKLNEFMSFVDKSKPVTMHGNFTDSIPYYQISLPLINDKGLQQLIQQKMEQARIKDSVVETIKSYAKYQIYSPTSDNYSLAWDKNHLVVYGLLDENNRNYYNRYEIDTVAAVVDSAAIVVDSVAVADEYIVAEPAVAEAQLVAEAPVDSSNPDAAVESDAVIEEYDEEYYAKLEEEAKKEREKERLEIQVKQEAQLAMLFENGFTMPVSDKVNTKADVSAWMDYQSAYLRMYNFRYLFRYATPKGYEAAHSVKGVNFDFYFENDKARVEQTVEYSEPMAKIVAKIISGKANKELFNYFPKEEPLAHMAYHINTEETLKNYPQLIEQLLSNLPMEKQDTEIIIDLFSTLIDEEATATIMDGDIAAFLHTVESYSEKITTSTFNENYEEVFEEKTVNKTRPVFSVVITSSHPTLANKLLDLGLRKKGLIKENNYYVIEQSSPEFGPIVLLKEGDVFVITNGLNYLSNGVKSDFAANVKKDWSKNYFTGNLNIGEFIKSMAKADDFKKDADKIAKVSKQFKNLQFRSSKKLKDNKMKVDIEFNSNNNTRNIILQSLDVIDFLK